MTKHLGKFGLCGTCQEIDCCLGIFSSYQFLTELHCCKYIQVTQIHTPVRHSIMGLW